MKAEEVNGLVNKLVDAWCERRNIMALKSLLAGWPLVSGLTDDWAGLLNALKDVRDYRSKELTVEEKGIIRFFSV